MSRISRRQNAGIIGDGIRVSAVGEFTNVLTEFRGVGNKSNMGSAASLHPRFATKGMAPACYGKLGPVRGGQSESEI